MNRCDGTVVDSRTLVRAEGFQQGDEMWFGFDPAHAQHMRWNNTHLRVRDGQLRCMKKEYDGVKLRPVAVLSFVAMYYWHELKHPETISTLPNYESGRNVTASPSNVHSLESVTNSLQFQNCNCTKYLLSTSREY